MRVIRPNTGGISARREKIILLCGNRVEAPAKCENPPAAGRLVPSANDLAMKIVRKSVWAAAATCESRSSRVICTPSVRSANPWPASLAARNATIISPPKPAHPPNTEHRTPNTEHRNRTLNTENRTLNTSPSKELYPWTARRTTNVAISARSRSFPIWGIVPAAVRVRKGPRSFRRS
jgi:hypothetical protein